VSPHYLLYWGTGWHVRSVRWPAGYCLVPGGYVHELSIALGVVETASEEAARLGATRVNAVFLRLGPLAGVVEDALRFSFEVAVRGTPIDGARLEIELVPLVARCPSCDAPCTLPSIQRFACPVCGAPTPELISGRECQLVALEIEDDASTDR
jgi:hydrogenase nickel incorporation protein HypA/HybF